MALQITSNQGIFEINGYVIGKNVRSLHNHFEQLLEHTDQIIISIDKIKNIDSAGVKALTKLYKKAMKSNKIFHVIGEGNKIVKKAFGENNYIIRKDFI